MSRATRNATTRSAQVKIPTVKAERASPEVASINQENGHELKPKPKPKPNTASINGDDGKATPSPRKRKIKDEDGEDLHAVTKKEEQGIESKTTTNPSPSLREKKMKLLEKNSAYGPFPDFPRPYPEEAHLAHRILASLHGARTRPIEVIASKERAGCGDSPSVLDALVRTILSQNTSDTNSTRAKLNMDKVYGGSDEWERIVSGGVDKLQEAIKSGGLSVVKSKVITNILQQVKEKYGVYSLDHLHQAETDDAMQELLSFDGVGPKTASCVLLFCLQREDFAVDTHVFRITGLLGWRPKKANREQTYHHLNKRIPDEDKYGLHILLVNHGKKCQECKAGGSSAGKCELRKAFRDKVIKGELGQDIKQDLKPFTDDADVDAKPEIKGEIE